MTHLTCHLVYGLCSMNELYAAMDAILHYRLELTVTDNASRTTFQNGPAEKQNWTSSRRKEMLKELAKWEKEYCTNNPHSIRTELADHFEHIMTYGCVKPGQGTEDKGPLQDQPHSDVAMALLAALESEASYLQLIRATAHYPESLHVHLAAAVRYRTAQFKAMIPLQQSNIRLSLSQVMYDIKRHNGPTHPKIERPVQLLRMSDRGIATSMAMETINVVAQFESEWSKHAAAATKDLDAVMETLRNYQVVKDLWVGTALKNLRQDEARMKQFLIQLREKVTLRTAGYPNNNADPIQCILVRLITYQSMERVS